MLILEDLKEKERILEIERGGTRSHSVENSPFQEAMVLSRDALRKE